MWRSLALLHNLSIEEPILTEHLAIVPPEDERALPLLQSSKPLARMVGGFTDQFKRKVRPSLLLAKSDAPVGVLNAEALVAFRNSVALCTIVQASQEYAVREQAFNLLRYSNYFQIYPITVARNGDYLITNTPSLLGMDVAKDFRGQTSPELAHMTPRGVFYDKELFAALMVAWEKRYAKGKKKEWQTRALFRSLEMAFLASGIPFGNNATIYDYGASISLWVSALEILFHPGNTNINKSRVIEGLGSHLFNEPALSKRKYRIHLNKVVSATLVQKIASQLYDVRNDFLHGNNVEVSSLFPFERRRRHPLTLYAPMVYKTALAVRLGLVRGDGYGAYSLSQFTQYVNARNFEGALLSSLRDRKE